MSHDVELGCRCGHVHGWVRGASPQAVNRAVCYCDDCQAFLHYLGRADLLDGHGGSDIVQVAPASLSFDRGTDRIACVRLGPKGLYRWYASCCKMPLGNTVGPALPFVGITTEIFRPEAPRRDEIFGKARASVYGQFATGGAPPGSTKIDLPMMAHVIRSLLRWKLRGQTWPHPFFDRESKKPRYAVTILSAAERDALRPMCGPHPTAPATA